MKRVALIIMLIGCALVSLQQMSYAASEKMTHKDYASMKIRECNECHKSEGVALTHDADWVNDWISGHRLVAARASKNCNQCHQQSFCLDCHQGGGIGTDLKRDNFGRDYKPKTHRSDFRTLHPLKAKDNPQSCVRCHDQKYCSECHSKYKRNDIQFKSHRTQFSDIPINNLVNHGAFSPNACQGCHPGGNVPKHIWSSEHSAEARRNLQACQSCHETGDVCVKCHSARTGLKKNPHPRNWGAISGNLKSRSGGRSCIQCHDKF